MYCLYVEMVGVEVVLFRVEKVPNGIKRRKTLFYATDTKLVSHVLLCVENRGDRYIPNYKEFSTLLQKSAAL